MAFITHKNAKLKKIFGFKPSIIEKLHDCRRSRGSCNCLLKEFAVSLKPLFGNFVLARREILVIGAGHKYLPFILGF